ncbi:hypothetical protein EJ04DRAFT_508509 [Polyplosphaeria fusca]|uniref:Uncharacterized protein n=1 Tax=Polyplosphaeria fusca TaxID=682080 RepID=A0A9P4R5R4_9PLEO|nr:hypothetical protein EJ04DRAFT_508509 [Polyplosphaeria fusca]
MAPPGAIPPGYAYQGIPQSFMARKPVPEGEDTNTRAYVIFFSYLTLCVSLTVFILQRLLKSYAVLSKSTTARTPPKKHVLIFAFLAAASLVATWYHMLQYFKWSYTVWSTWRSFYTLDPNHLHWGLWLKQTSLFREAWETAITAYSRYWWTHQVFLFACGLGLDLEQKGIPRGIKHTWAFMLLGQVVAVSFATNLFLLALLLSPPPLPGQPSRAASTKKRLGPWVINLAAIVATLSTVYLLLNKEYWHSDAFMPLLLTSHVALLVLPCARVLLPQKYSEDDPGTVGKIYDYLWRLTAGGGALLFLRATATQYNYSGFQGIWDALFEHSAVSTVAFDVIFCWISWITWWVVRGANLDDNIKAVHEGLREKDEKESSWSDAGGGTATIGGHTSAGGEFRRR